MRRIAAASGPAPAVAEPGIGRAGSLALLVAMSLVWGLNWPAMKIVVGELPVATFRVLCLWFAGPALLLIAAQGGERIRVPGPLRGKLVVASFFNMFGWSLLSAIGLTMVEAGRAGILAYTMPVWAAILARFWLGERLTRRRLLGLACGMAGIAVLLVPDLARLGAAPLGSLLVLLAAITWAIGTVYIKRVDWGMSMAQLTGWQQVLSGLPFAVAALLLDPPGALFQMSFHGLLVLLYVLTLPMIFANWIWMVLLDRLPASVAGLSTLAIPVVGVLSGALLLGERVGLGEAAALVLVVAALALVLAPERRA
jgi:drug/metabolite transporter (DMT)-like permease